MYLIVYKEDALSAFLVRNVFESLEQATEIARNDVKQQQGSAHIYEIKENKIHEVKVLSYMPYYGDKDVRERDADDSDDETIIELAY